MKGICLGNFWIDLNVVNKPPLCQFELPPSLTSIYLRESVSHFDFMISQTKGEPSEECLISSAKTSKTPKITAPKSSIPSQVSRTNF